MRQAVRVAVNHQHSIRRIDAGLIDAIEIRLLAKMVLVSEASGHGGRNLVPGVRNRALDGREGLSHFALAASSPIRVRWVESWDESRRRRGGSDGQFGRPAR